MGLFDVHAQNIGLKKENRNKHCGIPDDIWRLSGYPNHTAHPNRTQTLVAAWPALAAFTAWAYFLANHPDSQQAGFSGAKKTHSASHGRFCQTTKIGKPPFTRLLGPTSACSNIID
jgi:hypothetical protein